MMIDGKFVDPAFEKNRFNFDAEPFTYDDLTEEARNAVQKENRTA